MLLASGALRWFHCGVETKWITPALLGIQSAFQGALAAGAPWGRASYGGRYDARLPHRARQASAAASLVYAAAAAVLCARHTPPGLERGLYLACTGVGALGAVANAASPSRLEKLWSLWSLGLGAASWHELRRSRRA